MRRLLPVRLRSPRLPQFPNLRPAFVAPPPPPQSSWQLTGDGARFWGSRSFCAAARCWNCGAGDGGGDGPFLACGSCRSVQPVDSSVDYFQIFGLAKKYEVKEENLHGKYKDWVKKLHPDLFHLKSEKEKNYAAEQSARVTNAYRTLSKPLSRAMYLLQREGVHVDEEKTISDPELLAEVMEIRESVDEANDPDSLKKILSELHRKFDKWSGLFGDAFNKQNFEEGKLAILRMTYYERAIEEVVKKL